MEAEPPICPPRPWRTQLSSRASLRGLLLRRVWQPSLAWPTSLCPQALRLQDWRARVAAQQKVPAFVIFTDATIAAIAERQPARPADLVAIVGIGPRKLGLYGEAVLALVSGASVNDLMNVDG